MNNLSIKALGTDALTEIFENHMRYDFSRSELTPLRVLQKLLKKGKYIFYGFYENGELRAYAGLVECKSKNALLLDYFAVIKEFRNMGFGSEALKLLFEKAGEKPIILEVENPDFAQSESEKSTRLSRIGFYTRAGVRLTKENVNVFRVNFLLMYYSEKELNRSELLDLFKALYHIKFSRAANLIFVKTGC